MVDGACRREPQGSLALPASGSDITVGSFALVPHESLAGSIRFILEFLNTTAVLLSHNLRKCSQS